MALFILLIAAGFYSTAVLFALRYSQTVGNWVYRMLSRLKWAVSFHVFVLIVGLGTVVLPIHMQWESSEELTHYFGNSDSELYKKMNEVAFVGFKNFNWQGYLALYAAMAGAAVIGAVDLWGTIGSYYYLRQNRNSLSDRTVALYRVLINVLVADMFLSLFIGFVPMALTFAALLLRWHDGASVAVLALTVCMWYPCCANVILLSYVKPYRMAVRGLLRLKSDAKLFGKRNITVASNSGMNNNF
ncbi:hypothetical protein AAVH_11456 [Aphelenchoides avenae]|nr:hypothetical protein AAVH_11456 [Aphelenchus avenae]